jgi:Leucine-rich repeat (LRR) protein
MPADEQVRAVAAKLKELNPGFDGEVTHKVEGGVVTALQFVTDEVTDVSPVRALPGLRLLECNGSASGKGKLADLSPLKGMKLTNLACYFTQVSDLSPLEGMKLRRLHCSGTRVSDLSALKGTELSNLHCAGTRISDLSPLTGMKLTYLDCSRTPVSDLSPLKGMNLTGLACGVTKVSDLSPLMGMKLTNLNCERSKVTDLSPLKGMPLKTIRCPFVAERDAGLLRSLETLETINQQPAKEFWEGVDARQVAAAWLKRVAAMPADEQAAAVAARLKELNPGFDGEVAHKVEGGVVTELQFCTDEVTDISPVRALPGLGKLDCAGSRRRTGKFADLSPLKGMKLRHLICNSTQVSDLTPLKGTGLTTLVCFHTRVSDLSPLKGSKLTALNCGGTPVSDLSPLKGMKLTALRCWVVVLLGEQFA